MDFYINFLLVNGIRLALHEPICYEVVGFSAQRFVPDKPKGQ